MSLGQDWPTSALRDILDEYGFRILERERQRSGPAPWQRTLTTGEGAAYDPDATWTETHYTIRRDMICEACGQWFGYTFEVDQISRDHKSGRSTDGALRREISRQLRRRIRCTRCRTVQKEPRHALLREDRRQSTVGCALVFIGLLLSAAGGGLGGWLFGTVGLFVGLFVGLVSALAAWVYLFPYVLSIGPSV